MRVTFPGVGEAFDETLPNTCLLLEAGERSALLDCGFTAAHAFWACAGAPLRLDAVWISHFHGDHFLGLPLLLLRFWEQGRTAPLALLGPRGVGELAVRAMDMAYPGFRARLRFGLEVHEMEEGRTVEAAGFAWACALADHGAPCLAVRVQAEGAAVFYSGDGKPTAGTLALAREADLVAHEAYALDAETPGHGTVAGAIDFTRRARARRLWLVHVNRDVRRERRRELEALLRDAADVEAFLPEPGDAVSL
jgi:ribonuclease BN (tRNA processing enzyme)